MKKAVLFVLFTAVLAEHKDFEEANWLYLACTDDCIDRGHFFCVHEGFQNFNGHDEIEQGTCC